MSVALAEHDTDADPRWPHPCRAPHRQMRAALRAAERAAVAKIVGDFTAAVDAREAAEARARRAAMMAPAAQQAPA